MSAAINTIFKDCISDGQKLLLPDRQLKREAFLEIKKRLIGAGAKWKGGSSQYFLFPFPAEPIRLALEQGKKPNFKQDNQFFETPEEIIAGMVLWAGIEEGDDILEPSAGRFAIGRWLSEYCITYDRSPIDCYEANKHNQEYLRNQPLANLLGSDFLAATPTKLYDVILANPPFTGGAYIDHIMHMVKFLKPYGILVSVAPTGWYRTSKKMAKDAWWEVTTEATPTVKCRKFFEFLKQQSRYEVIDLEPNSFLESGTKVDTCLIIINGRHYR